MTPRQQLLNRYHAATPAQKRRGRAWYDAARAECERLADEYGVGMARVAAVLAITSPDAQLVTNIRWTEAALRRKRARKAQTSAGRYPANQLPKLRRALDGRVPNPGAAVSGPKVEAFYHAIMGDQDCLVIDRWASYAAGGPRDVPPRRKQREVIGQAYIEAARIAGESVRDFQAIIWIQARESTPQAKTGTVHNRFDF